MSKLYDVPENEEEYVEKEIRIKAGDAIKILFSFLVFVVCIITSVWMIYNLITTGSVFPLEMDVVELIGKSFKGFKL